MRNLLIAIILFSTLLFLSCSGNSTSNKGASSVDFSAGEKIYKLKCAVCHQAGGMGVPQVFPPLANNQTVSGDKTYLIKTILDGLTGPLEVNGVKYNGVMTPFNNLSDKEVADLLTFMRGSLGNNGDAVTEQEVKAFRIKQ